MSEFKLIFILAIIFIIMSRIGYEPTHSELFLCLCIIGAGYIASSNKD